MQSRRQHIPQLSLIQVERLLRAVQDLAQLVNLLLKLGRASPRALQLDIHRGPVLRLQAQAESPPRFLVESFPDATEWQALALRAVHPAS